MTRLLAIVTLIAASESPFLATNAAGQPLELAGHGFAPVSGTRLFYEVKGTGAALVLIHGGQMDCRMWDDQFAVLARQVHRHSL